MAYTPFYTNLNIESDESLIKSLFFEDKENFVDEKFQIKENGDWTLVHGEFFYPRKHNGDFDEVLKNEFEIYFYPAIQKADSEQIMVNSLPEGLDISEEDKKRKIFFPETRLLYDDLCLIIDNETRETLYSLTDKMTGKYKTTNLGKINNLRVAIPTLIPFPKSKDKNESSIEHEGVIRQQELIIDTNGMYKTKEGTHIIRLEKNKYLPDSEGETILNFWYENFGHSAKTYIASLVNQILLKGRMFYKQHFDALTDLEKTIYNKFEEEYRSNPSDDIEHS